ncbi:MAG: FkbM family methyltransferase [Proteobacteria bacterium]|nr:FkbM family methyltransferase [Pseudomonadota bacterium]
MNDNLPPYGAYAPKGVVAGIIGFTRALPGTWIAKRVGFLARRIGIAMLGGKPVDAESIGARFRLYPYNNVCEKRILFSPRDFDEKEREWLAARIGERFTFLDIGANVGGYSLYLAAKAGPSGRIIAIEPQPEVFGQLSYNIRLNPFGNVKAIEAAVADRNGELTLFLDPKNKGEASVKIVSADEARQVKVPARTLLDVATSEGLDHIDAIKLDVEGAEDIIMKRFFLEAPESLWPKAIVVERGEERWGIDLLGLLAERGYVIVGKTRNNHLMERRA